MRTRSMVSWFVLPAVAAATLVAFAPAADAGHGNGRGRGQKQWRQTSSRYCRPARPARRVAYVQPGYYARPVYVEPRYYQPQRVVVVRPQPYVRIGGRFGSVNISAVFGPRRQYSNYQYGCNFCDDRFSSYDAYSNHVQSCSHRPDNCQVQARRWNDSDCGNGQVGYNDGYDDAGYYDDGSYSGGSNDGYYEDGN